MLTNSQTGKGESIYREPFRSQTLNSSEVGISSFYRPGKAGSAGESRPVSREGSQDPNLGLVAPGFRRATSHSFLPTNHPRSPAGSRLWAHTAVQEAAQSGVPLQPSTEVLGSLQAAPGGTATSRRGRRPPRSRAPATRPTSPSFSPHERGRGQNVPSSLGGLGNLQCMTHGKQNVGHRVKAQ